MPRTHTDNLRDEAPHLVGIIDQVYRGRLRVSRVIDGAYDSNWTKENEYFYSRNPKSKPYVRRVLLKDGPRFKGFVHLRPISDWSHVSETYLEPPREMQSGFGQRRYYLKCAGQYSAYDRTVACVPFIMPETIFGMCTHGSIWIALKILEHFTGKKVEACTIPRIQELASGKPYTDQSGLWFNQIARLLRMCYCNSFYISNVEHNLEDIDLWSTLYAWIESGLPVILGVDVKDLPWWDQNRHGNHSIVVIGHTMEHGRVDGLIVHDESKYPYQYLSKSDLFQAWHGNQMFKDRGDKRHYVREAVVAVPAEVGLRAEIFLQEYLGYLKTTFVKFGIAKDIENTEQRPMLVNLQEFYRLLFTLQDQSQYKFFEFLRPFFARLPTYLWAMIFYRTPEDRMNGRHYGFFFRDATLESAAWALYLLEPKIAAYQIGPSQPAHSLHETPSGALKRESW